MILFSIFLAGQCIINNNQINIDQNAQQTSLLDKKNIIGDDDEPIITQKAPLWDKKLSRNVIGGDDDIAESMQSVTDLKKVQSASGPLAQVSKSQVDIQQSSPIQQNISSTRQDGKVTNLQSAASIGSAPTPPPLNIPLPTKAQNAPVQKVDVKENMPLSTKAQNAPVQNQNISSTRQDGKVTNLHSAPSIGSAPTPPPLNMPLPTKAQNAQNVPVQKVDVKENDKSMSDFTKSLVSMISKTQDQKNDKSQEMLYSIYLLVHDNTSSIYEKLGQKESIRIRDNVKALIDNYFHNPQYKLAQYINSLDANIRKIVIEDIEKIFNVITDPKTENNKIKRFQKYLPLLQKQLSALKEKYMVQLIMITNFNKFIENASIMNFAISRDRKLDQLIKVGENLINLIAHTDISNNNLLNACNDLLINIFNVSKEQLPNVLQNIKSISANKTSIKKSVQVQNNVTEQQDTVASPKPAPTQKGTIPDAPAFKTKDGKIVELPSIPTKPAQNTVASPKPASPKQGVIPDAPPLMNNKPLPSLPKPTQSKPKMTMAEEIAQAKLKGMTQRPEDTTEQKNKIIESQIKNLEKKKAQANISDEEIAKIDREMIDLKSQLTKPIKSEVLEQLAIFKKQLDSGGNIKRKNQLDEDSDAESDDSDGSFD